MYCALFLFVLFAKLELVALTLDLSNRISIKYIKGININNATVPLLSAETTVIIYR